MVEGYSVTELTRTATGPLAGEEVSWGSVGLPMPHAIVEIVDLEDGLQELEPGEPGEICFRGSHVMLGYRHEPEANAAALRGGRLNFGDIGCLSANGYRTSLGKVAEGELTG